MGRLKRLELALAYNVLNGVRRLNVLNYLNGALLSLSIATVNDVVGVSALLSSWNSRHQGLLTTHRRTFKNK